MKAIRVIISAILISVLLCCCAENGKTISGNGWTANEDGTISGNGWTIDENGSLSGNGWFIDESGVLTGNKTTQYGWYVNEDGLPCGEDHDWWLSESGEVCSPITPEPGLETHVTCLSESGQYKAEFVGSDIITYLGDLTITLTCGDLTITFTDEETTKTVSGTFTIRVSYSDGRIYLIDFTQADGSVIEGFMMYDPRQKSVTQLYDIDPIGGANTVYYEAK